MIRYTITCICPQIAPRERPQRVHRLGITRGAVVARGRYGSVRHVVPYRRDRVEDSFFASLLAAACQRASEHIVVDEPDVPVVPVLLIFHRALCVDRLELGDDIARNANRSIDIGYVAQERQVVSDLFLGVFELAGGKGGDHLVRLIERRTGDILERCLVALCSHRTGSNLVACGCEALAADAVILRGKASHLDRDSVGLEECLDLSLPGADLGLIS